MQHEYGVLALAMAMISVDPTIDHLVALQIDRW
jgi:hypothetical protein